MVSLCYDHYINSLLSPKIPILQEVEIMVSAEMCHRSLLMIDNPLKKIVLRDFSSRYF